MEGFTPQRRVLSVLRGKVSALNYSYSGSWDIPLDWLELSGLLPYQKIALINPRPRDVLRERTVYTYVLPAPRGSGCMNANGGIAHYFEAGGEVIIQSYGTYLNAHQASTQRPTFLDARTFPPQYVEGDAIQFQSGWLDFVSGKLHFACVNAVIEHVGHIEGDHERAQAVLESLADHPAMQALGQPVCVLSQDIADLVGFHSYEAISLYPVNGSPRFNRSVMCWVVPGLEQTFVLMGEGLSGVVKPGDRMVACRYTSLGPEDIYGHTAKVHVLDAENRSQKMIEYRMDDYLTADLKWKK